MPYFILSLTKDLQQANINEACKKGGNTFHQKYKENLQNWRKLRKGGKIQHIVPNSETHVDIIRKT